jgi:antitoxin component of RelBE/YafQ-DinJ toxin-antitoxin module
MPRTPNRAVRVPDDLWEEAQRVAADRGEPLSEAIRRFLREYVRDHPAAR